MSDANSERNPQYFVHSLRQYVLAPLSTASRLVETERAEVVAELDAYETFRDRLREIDPAPSTPPDAGLPGRDTTSDRIERVRDAYRDTVLSTPHYDESYGEPLVAHLGREFGAGIADAFRPDSAVSFTAPYKRTLEARTTGSIRMRRDFVDTLDAEAESIEDARGDLSTVFAALDTTIIPEWHCESFTDDLDAVAQRRQQTIQRRDSVPQFDEHSLCALLYDDEPWTYPVLTAVARTREAVSLEQSPNPGRRNSARG
ncbi:DUF7260 family protein [Halobacterium hubeiense]|uniref:DUF7260 family protein n=1 Tax=Halobacterium hubeiense TaxID=1407499 RepID=UPI003C73DADA